MFTVSKRMEIAGSHSLKLPYDSPCAKQHGHNWIVTVEITSEETDSFGMVFDFAHIKEEVMTLDHENLNDIIPCNPTAENIAQFLCKAISQIILIEYQKGNVHMSTRVSKVTVQESEGNIACFTP